ncbi:hypothetical protein PFAG_00968 [Plasmodium falciparum Santa Lucia]|uniref:Uncharacterized protein n=1 Tax=Plasmodium falciparum Santa Lucia TaxID=478859 RepID=W7G2U7_PLAFA|nr:hypothetical protein PFAG_00968 [Plasmodium falciparum Santa Lucia]
MIYKKKKKKNWNNLEFKGFSFSCALNYIFITENVTKLFEKLKFINPSKIFKTFFYILYTYNVLRILYSQNNTFDFIKEIL